MTLAVVIFVGVIIACGVDLLVLVYRARGWK